MNYNSAVYILVRIGEGLHLIKGLLITFIKEAIGRAIVEGTGIPQLMSEIGTRISKAEQCGCKMQRYMTALLNISFTFITIV